MAHALASPRTSAHIIPLPGAALAPITQRKGPGRYPTMVAPPWQMRQLRHRRLQAEARTQVTAQPNPVENTPAQELEYAADWLACVIRLRTEALQRLRAAQQHIQASAPSAGATLYHFPTYR